MFMYLEATNSKGRPTGKFNCRGAVGKTDNPESFISLMKRKGLRAILVTEHKGDRNVPASVLGLKEEK